MRLKVNSKRKRQERVGAGKVTTNSCQIINGEAEKVKVKSKKL